MNSAIPLLNPLVLHYRKSHGDSVHLVDVRTPAEYADGHAAGALSLPLEQLDSTRLGAQLGSEAGRQRPVYLICASGQRAQSAAEKLQAQGMNNLVVVEGGTEAWAAHRLPMKQPRRLPHLERQAQIALGVLILLILAKGTLLHPAFHALIGLLGIGLIVSGITARCSLSALLARMPWNRSPVGKTAPSM